MELMQAKQSFNEGTGWTAERARMALPILLMTAKSAQTLTYAELDQLIARENGVSTTPVVAGYGKVLEIVGRSLNALSVEWGTELPPLTILVVNKDTGEPGAGVGYFLQRYISTSSSKTVTANNRRAMILRATEAVHNDPRWDEVAAYFEIELPDMRRESVPIPLEKPPARLGPESAAHLALKNHVAAHPELFADIGLFSPGQIEYRLDSGDEVDVFFANGEQALAVEIKTAVAPLGELTRGLYQCVKYRAVLRAMVHVKGELVNARAILVTPQALPPQHREAAGRLAVPWRRVEMPGQ